MMHFRDDAFSFAVLSGPLHHYVFPNFFSAPSARAESGFKNFVGRTQSSHSNHENKMEERSKRYKKIDFLGEGQV